MLQRCPLTPVASALLAATLAVSLAPPLQAQQTAVARVLEMTGRVSVLRDNVEWALNVGSPVQPKQIVRTGPDGYAKFQLSDGSTFEVFQDSQAVFRANPGNWSDVLDVVIGRVKVFIQHRDGPKPSRVTTQTAVISVRGTIFDVVVEDEDATTLVSVDEGIVGVRHALLGGNETELQAGESVRVFRNQPLARRMDKGNAAHKALRAAAQAVYQVMLARSGAPSGGPGGVPAGGGNGGGAQGDKGKGGNAPPPPPPPPPPPTH